jgi:hypothetical protein
MANSHQLLCRHSTGDCHRCCSHRRCSCPNKRRRHHSRCYCSAATASAAAALAETTATAEAAAVSGLSASGSKKRKAQEAVDEAVGEKDALVASLYSIIAKRRKAQAAINAAVDVKDALLAEFNSVKARYTDACTTVRRCQAALVDAGDSWQSALACAARLSTSLRRYEPTSIDYVPTSPTHSAASYAGSDSNDSVATPSIAANGAPRCKPLKWH